jgi:beta-glucosidase
MNAQEIERRIDSLLGRLTLQEKIGQLNQLAPNTAGIPAMIRQGKVGSLLDASGVLGNHVTLATYNTMQLNTIQKIAMEETPAKIPLLFGRDVIHGYRTVFPIPLGMAAAFDPGLTERACQISAREASADGVKWTFAPMVDIARDSRWGRIAEGAGEDPYLGCLQAVAAVRGFQGEDYSDPQRLAACAKHFAGYGAAEGGRDYEAAEITQHTLREVYLRPFKACWDAGAATFMSAFEDLGGVPMTASRSMLSEVLREEWGFDGFVVSDWNSIGELVPHGVAGDLAQASALALSAGVDMDMCAMAYIDHLESCLVDGRVTITEIEQAVRRILRVKLRAGLFENPFTDPQRAQQEILTDESRVFAREAAACASVLLKNRHDLLPLDDRIKHLAVVGPLVHAQEELFGCWAPDGRKQDVTPFSTAFQAAGPRNVEMRFASQPDKALELIFKSDAVILVVGETQGRNGENNNVADLGLPVGQKELVMAASRMGKPLILVVVAGRALAIPDEIAAADAVLFVFHPGIEGGGAIGEVVFGKLEPGGRLPLSLPRATGQMPLYYNHKNSGRPVDDEGFENWSRRYVDIPHGALFPFGYGLTYARFSYANLVVSRAEMNERLEISAEITNTGLRPGSETVQLYVRDRVGQLTRPVKELKGFQRVTLQPGERRRVQFTLERDALAYYGPDNKLVLDPGDHFVWIGPNSAEGLKGEFRVR